MPSSAEAGRAEVRRSAALVAAACVMQVAESLVPHPVPGIRLGLANVVTLVAMAELGFRAALEVALLRTVVASLVLGSFLSPGFILSFFSAAASAVVMRAFWVFSARFPRWGFGLAGVSVAGAAAHNAAQLGLAYLLLVRHESIFYFAPWLAVSAVVMGWLTALAAAQVLKAMGGGFAAALPRPRPASASAPAGMPAAPELKLAAACALLLAAVLAADLRVFACMGLGLLLMMAATRLPASAYAALWRRLRGLSWLAAVSFFFPLFFTPAIPGGALLEAGPLVLSAGGLEAGAVFAARVLVMAWIGFLLNVYAAPAEIAAGITRLGRVLGPLGFRAERAGAVIALAWEQLPGYTARARAVVAAAVAGRGWRDGPVRWSVGLAAGVIAGMCVPETETGRPETAAA